MRIRLIVQIMNRCGLCGGTTDGEPAADNPSEVADGQANGCVKPHDESCLADVTLDTKKADGFGAGTGWLGRLLGPLGEQFGVGGVWVHENCAIWSPEVGFCTFILMYGSHCQRSNYEVHEACVVILYILLYCLFISLLLQTFYWAGVLLLTVPPSHIDHYGIL